MKKILKKIIPAPVISQVRGLRDHVKLRLTPRAYFNHAPLNHQLTAHTLESFFKNEDIAKAWDSAIQKITPLYKNVGKEGGVNPGDRRALYYLIHALRPQNVLEVGTHIGASTVYIAEALKASNPQARLTTVDILDVNAPAASWSSLKLPMPPRAFLEQLGTSDIVTFKAQPSTDFLRTTTEKFDFIFLDGDHAPHTVYKELSLALKAMNEDGVILLHDYYPGARAIFNDGNIIHGPYLALDRIQRENRNIHTLPLGNLPWETKNGLKITSLALVTKVKST